MKGHLCRYRRDQPDGMGTRSSRLGQGDSGSVKFSFHDSGYGLEARVDTPVVTHMPQPPASVDFGGLSSLGILFSQRDLGGALGISHSFLFLSAHAQQFLTPTGHSMLQSLW